MKQRIRYLSVSVANQLYDGVPENLDRYRNGDFLDLSSGGGWSAELSSTMETSALELLSDSKGPETEIQNTLLVWQALGTIPPSIAVEGRVWARLAHVECLEYCRARWLTGVEEDELESGVRTHFFALTRTQIRDDHALARLWWNYCVASQSYPEDPVAALTVILKSADIRSNFIERPWISSRRQLARGIIRRMLNDSWTTSTELNYREFMKAVNRIGSGVVFEVLEDAHVDEIMGEAKSLAEGSMRRSSGTPE